jgi:DNA-binding NarL/FixJ family response regulator
VTPTVLSTLRSVCAKTILLADDNEQMRNLIREALERNGRFEIVGEATTGADAVAKPKALAPDLVILDVSMPGLNGLEVAGILRYIEPKIRILMLMMYAEDISKNQASVLRIDAVFSKSDGLAKLIEQVESLRDDQPNDDGCRGRLNVVSDL